jgi:hypothetical protein
MPYIIRALIFLTFTALFNQVLAQTDAASFGFSPDASGITNTQALQRAVDQTGTIIVSKPGIYQIAGTVLLGSKLS